MPIYNTTLEYWLKVIAIFILNKITEILKKVGYILLFISGMILLWFTLIAIISGIGFVMIKLDITLIANNDNMIEYLEYNGVVGLLIIGLGYGIIVGIKKMPEWIKNNWELAKKELEL